MAIIDTGSPAYRQDSRQFWIDELENSRILLLSVDKAIHALTTVGIAEYTIDTGQDRQTVKRSDLSMLQSQRSELISLIATLESRLQIGGSRASQVVPL
jgi:hypothetical protein